MAIPPGDPHADGWRRLGRIRINALALGIVLSVLLHLALLWWAPKPPPLKTESQSGGSGPLAIRIAPRQPATTPTPAPPAETPAAAPRPTPKPAPRPTPAPRVIAVPAPNAPAAPDRTRVPPDQRPAERPLPPLPPLPPDTPNQAAPADDMFGQLQSRRAQRDSGQQGPAAPAARSENDIANDNARRNLATLTGRGRDPLDETGGIFQVTRITSREGEILFRGWNANFKRNWSESVQVQLGDAPDMQTAVARKMIEIIRRYEKGDFTWDSHRLGKTLTLSARPEHQADLERFLLAEFFGAR